MRNLLLVSSSVSQKGGDMFVHAREAIVDLLGDKKTLLFIPYARPDGIKHEDYTAKIREAFEAMGLPNKVVGIESFANPRTALETAEAVFIGGGNTFYFLKYLNITKTKLKFTHF